MTKDEYFKKIAEAKERARPKPITIPHSCAGCEHLTDEGLCTYFQDYPPLEYIEQENDCEGFLEIVPF